MIKILAIIFLFFSSHLYAYDEEEIICIATYELAKNFFLEMKDKKTSQEIEMRQQKLFNKYEKLSDEYFEDRNTHHVFGKFLDRSDNFDKLLEIELLKEQIKILKKFITNNQFEF